MSEVEKKINEYKNVIGKNLLNPKNISYINIQSNFPQKEESIEGEGSEFERQIKKIFHRKKFLINNQYDHNGAKNFLKEKDECLKKIEMEDDSILYKKVNMHKKSKHQKNRYKSHQNLKLVDNKEKVKIKTNNQKVIDSFLSNKSGEIIEELLNSLN